jgi:hypothetical protein
MSEPVVVHIAETEARRARPLCKQPAGHRVLVWALAKARAPARVYLGSTGFTVPVPTICEVQAQGGRSLQVCSACEKALGLMSGRLEKVE